MCTCFKFKIISGPVRTVICGGIGGVILWTVIFPTDVVKSRIQINKLNITLLACLKDIAQKEGIYNCNLLVFSIRILLLFFIH